MPNLISIPNHNQQAQSRLLEQYQDRPKLSGLLSSLVNPLQEIEDELLKLKKERMLEEAEGTQLDALGKIVGELRGDKGDKEYRIAILCKIFINRSGGTPKDIINAVDAIYRPQRIEYGELYPATFKIYLQIKDFPKGIKSLIQSIKPITTTSVITYSTCKPFGFSKIITQKYGLGLINQEEIFQAATEENATLTVATDEEIAGNSGFGEIVIQKQALQLNQGETLMLNNNISLALVASIEDFTIQGGESFVEIVDHD